MRKVTKYALARLRSFTTRRMTPLRKAIWNCAMLASFMYLPGAANAQQKQADSQAGSPTPKSSCANNEVHKLDFLLGDWVSATADLTPETGSHGSGTNHFEAALGGCAIVQRRFEEKDGKKLFDSMVIWAYDAALNRLREFVISDDLNARYMKVFGKTIAGPSTAIALARLTRCGCCVCATSRDQTASPRLPSSPRTEARHGSKQAAPIM